MPLPQTLLKNKSYDIQSMVSALQGLNGKVAALATQATAAAKPGALDLYTATTSSDKVVATTTAAAKAGSIDFQVNKLAQTQVTVTPKVNAVTGWPYTTMTINSGGKDYTITPHRPTLDDVVTAVNAAGRWRDWRSKVCRRRWGIPAPVHGHEVRQRRRLHHYRPGTTFTDVTNAQDAEIVLWPGTAAAQTPSSLPPTPSRTCCPA